jgi:hypothetical protein
MHRKAPIAIVAVVVAIVLAIVIVITMATQSAR